MEVLGLDLGFTWWQAAIIVVAGLWSGLINTIVGSGTLVTFPVLVTLGVPPVSATISNAIGLIAGNLTGAWGYRKQLAGVESALLRLIPCSVAGAIVGSSLLLHLPESVFHYVAPVLIACALVFVLAQPALQAKVRARATQAPQRTGGRQPWPIYPLVFLTGIYGGYFVAAQGVLLLGILGVFLLASLQSANAVKTVLVSVVNIVAACSYLLFAFDRIVWPVVLLIAVSSTVGSWVGARVGQRLSPTVLRAVIVVLGCLALINMLREILF